MVAQLSYEPRPIVVNFYENSFKQCSSIQQKQIGLLLGAAIGDAAAISLDGWSAEEIRLLEEQLNNLESELSKETTTTITTTKTNAIRKSVKRAEVAFLQNVERPLSSMNNTIISNRAHRSHSYTYELYNELVRTMSRARGEFPVNYVEPQWVSRAREANHEDEYVNEHASLLHTLNALLPLPTLYPYADDETLRTYALPFASFLTETTLSTEQLITNNTIINSNTSSCSSRNENNRMLSNQTLYELAHAEKAAVIAHTMSMLSVALRYLQSNPNAIVNSAHMAIPGTSYAFPRHAATYCSSELATHYNNSLISSIEFTRERQRLCINRAHAVNHAGTTPEHFLPRRPVMCDVRVLRESLSIAHIARSFASGIRTAIRLGGNTAHRAMFVGALLGARFGIRSIPMEWLSATEGREALATMAIDIAQWSWNPPVSNEEGTLTEATREIGYFNQYTLA